jgi:hypothetical protein
METHIVFTSAIYLLVFILSFFSIKTCLEIASFGKMAQKRNLTFEENIKDEKEKLGVFNEQVLLIDSLNASLFDRLFQICKDFILLQKFIFEKYVN